MPTKKEVWCCSECNRSFDTEAKAKECESTGTKLSLGAIDLDGKQIPIVVGDLLLAVGRLYTPKVVVVGWGKRRDHYVDPLFEYAETPGNKWTYGGESLVKIGVAKDVPGRS